MVRKIYTIFFSLLFSFSFSFAKSENIPSQIQTKFETMLENFYPVVEQNALGLLVAFGVIQLVLTFGFMAIRGELEVGGAFAQLVKTALIIGFFSMLIKSPSWFNDIFHGFDKLGIQAGNISLDKIINELFKLWWNILKHTSIWEIGSSIAYIIVGAIATVSIIYLVANALMIYGFMIMSIYVGILFLGFGGLDQTRPWAINSIANVVRYSAKWMATLIVISISFSLINDALQNATNDAQGIITLFIISIMVATIGAGVNGWVDSYFSGMGGGENNRGMQMATALMSGMAAGAAGAAMGAYQGAKGASDTIAAAAATGEEKSTLGKAASYFSGMASGATKGAMHGGGNFAQNWAKTIDPNSTTSSSSSSSGKNFASAANEQKVAQSDGDVGGATKGSFAEPNVGGEINPNKS